MGNEIYITIEKTTRHEPSCDNGDTHIFIGQKVKLHDSDDRDDVLSRTIENLSRQCDRLEDSLAADGRTEEQL